MRTIAVPSAWKPAWAAEYVQATYTPLVHDDATGLVETPQHVVCHCDNCGADWQTDCSTGQARTHIQRFCKVHLICTRQEAL